MDLIYNIIKNFSDNWKEYATAGSVAGFFALSAIAGIYDGKKIDDKPKVKKRNLENKIY